MSEQLNLPSGWKLTTLGEIADVIGGGTPKTNIPEYFEGGTIPWITPADLSGYTNKHISHGGRFITEEGLKNSSARMMPAGTILFTSRAPVGYVAIAANPVCTNQGFKSFVLKEGISPDYVYWYLKGSKELAESMASGTTFLELSGAKAKQIPFPLPPTIDDQQRIVAEIEKQFSRLDEAVASLKRIQANLKRYKAAVLKAAVEGKLTEQWRKDYPDVESADQLLKRILAERRAKWEESVGAKQGVPASPGFGDVGNNDGDCNKGEAGESFASPLPQMKAKGIKPKDDSWKKKYKEPAGPDTANLPELPEGWVWTALGQLAWSVKDGPHYSPKYSTSGIPFISGGNIRPEGIDFSSAKFITPELHAELSLRCKPEHGDLLYTKGGTTGIARINTETRDFNVWVHVAVLKLVDSIKPFYLQNALNSTHCYKQSQKYTHGVGNQDLGLTRMIWITVPLPPLTEQKFITEEIERRLSVTKELEVTIETNLKRAERLRQTILQRAFSGGLV